MRIPVLGVVSSIHLNEVLSIRAQELALSGYNASVTLNLNEVLSIRAQECDEWLPWGLPELPQ